MRHTDRTEARKEVRNERKKEERREGTGFGCGGRKWVICPRPTRGMKKPVRVSGARHFLNVDVEGKAGALDGENGCDLKTASIARSQGLKDSLLKFHLRMSSCLAAQQL